MEDDEVKVDEDEDPVSKAHELAKELGPSLLHQELEHRPKGLHVTCVCGHVTSQVILFGVIGSGYTA